MKLVVTMAALVLGLLIASAKSFYDTQSAQLIQLSANVVMLDRILSHYGPETNEARGLLHDAMASVIDEVWSNDPKDPKEAKITPKTARTDRIFEEIQQLSPQNDSQRYLRTQALNIEVDIARTRWSMFEPQARLSYPKGPAFRHSFITVPRRMFRRSMTAL